RAPADAPDRFDPRDDAEGAVELAAVRHGVEMRAGPDMCIARAADQVSRRIDVDLEPGRLHPAGRELVRAILLCTAADAIRADTGRPRIGVRGRQAEGVERLRRRRDEHALRLQVEVERLKPELAPEARLLVAAERNPGKRRVRHVDPDLAGLDARRDAVAARG